MPSPHHVSGVQTEGSRFAGTASVWVHAPDGPCYEQDVWDLTNVITRTSMASRNIDLTVLPDAYRSDVRDILLILAQPDHEAAVDSGVIRRGLGASPGALISAFSNLRIITRWGHEQGLHGFRDWTQRNADDLLDALENGEHRDAGEGVGPSTIRSYVDTLRLVREFSPALVTGLNFHPWGARSTSDISGTIREQENVTAPMPWDMWAPLVAAAWAVIDRFSPDIIAAVEAFNALPPAPRGPSGSNAVRIINEWNDHSGDFPLHTGFGRGKNLRGEPNKSLLFRVLGINDSILKPAHHQYSDATVTLLEQAAANPERGVHGGLHKPTVQVTHDDGSTSPWVAELGIGEAEHLISVLRAACYVIIASLTGMRDGEVQELRRNCITTWHGLPAISSTQFKSRDDITGEQRSWWAPEPVRRAYEVLEQVTPHPTHLFARSATNAGAYDSTRDVARLVELVNGNPETRFGRGRGLALSPIEMARGVSVNALTLRRSFSVYATTKPGAELGLGIQLGHSAWRLTTGYASDSRQRAVQHMSDSRKELLREHASTLVLGGTALSGPAADTVHQFRAQIIEDPARAERVIDALADRIHFGITNDCLWDQSAAGCKSDRPQLANHICVGVDCANALLQIGHRPVLEQSIGRLDGYLQRHHSNPALSERMRKDRANLARQVRRLDENTIHIGQESV